MKRLLFILCLMGWAIAHGAGAIVQETSNTDGSGTTGTSYSVAFVSNVTAGHYIHAICVVAGTGNTLTFTDTQGNTYTVLDNFNQTGSISTFAHAWAVAGSTGADTVHCNYTSTNYPGIWIREISGVSGIGGHGVSQGNATTLSATGTNTSQPAFWSALGDGAASGDAISATTGTQDATGWTYGGAFTQAVSSHLHVTTTGTQTASFALAGASNNMTALIAIFNESGGGGGPKYQFFLGEAIRPPLAPLARALLQPLLASAATPSNRY